MAKVKSTKSGEINMPERALACRAPTVHRPISSSAFYASPVFESSSRSEPFNRYPVALLSFILNIIQGLIYDVLRGLFEDRHLHAKQRRFTLKTDFPSERHWYHGSIMRRRCIRVYSEVIPLKLSQACQRVTHHRLLEIHMVKHFTQVTH